MVGALPPGAGGEAADATAVVLAGESASSRLAAYLGHRRDREADVVGALRAADEWRTPRELVAAIYPATLAPPLVAAAAAVVALHCLALVEEGTAQRQERALPPGVDATPGAIFRGVLLTDLHAAYRVPPAPLSS